MLHTTMPWAEAASTSILSRPTAHFTIALACVMAAMTREVIGVCGCSTTTMEASGARSDQFLLRDRAAQYQLTAGLANALVQPLVADGLLQGAIDIYNS